MPCIGQISIKEYFSGKQLNSTTKNIQTKINSISSNNIDLMTEKPTDEIKQDSSEEIKNLKEALIKKI